MFLACERRELKKGNEPEVILYSLYSFFSWTIRSVRLVQSERGRAGAECNAVKSGQWELGSEKRNPKETIMEKCKQSPRNSLDKKSQNIPPSCPQLSFFSFRSPPNRAGLPGNRGPAETVSGRRGAGGKKNVEKRRRESRA